MHDGPGLRSDTMMKWLEATRVRVSRRAFDGSPAPAPVIDAIAAACQGYRPFGDARVVLAAEPNLDVFTGLLGSYGKIVDAPHVLVVIVGAEGQAAQAHAGYVGEAATLEATRQGLASCWVGGFFDPRKAARLTDLDEQESVVAVVPIGYAKPDLSRTERTMRRLAHAHNRKPLEDIAPGNTDWPDWARAAAECVRIAPSAMNRQPWRLRCDGGALVIARDNIMESPRVTKALDCGIAMLHAELGALGAGAKGHWEDLMRDLDVARFTVETDAE